MYEFGVYSGHGLEDAVNILVHQDKLPVHRFLGFDSFIGLPKESDRVQSHEEWFEGQYNAVEFHGVKTPQQAIQKICARVPISGDRLYFFVGYYSDTLKDKKLIQQANLKPAIYVHMDVDMYISCKEALEFLVENNLFVDGTVIRYDDWYGTPEFAGGESLAHKETVEKYGLKFDAIDRQVYVYRGRS